MKEAMNIRPDYAMSTAYTGFYRVTTSAIPTDTDRYVVLKDTDELTIDPNEVGKYSIFEIAKWFLCKNPMTHKKLQKLCYYAQAWGYVLKGYKLIDSDFQAWVHGPVSPVLWEKFKMFGYDTIQIKGTCRAKIADDDKKLLEDVWDTYGEETGNALEALTHRELPWMEARRGYEPDERCSVVISPTTMASYYKSIYIGE